ncbi:MAG: DASS family sodium-coupled anion symporter [Candidatus Electryonea clarkiae]|nr:DASS family sodium-coupled anion symporter [Candidatus Electryonea clarkiae]MDP8285701.1 DASS family sodium-coupled anion symporter [Candidatus Electryonea clarkiae]
MNHTPQELSRNQSLLKLSICVTLAIILWFLPIPQNMPVQAWHIFAVFISVIISFILRPFPMGAMVLFGLVAMMVTKTLTPKEALSGYGDSTVWLVVAAFLIAGGVVQTGFGRRLALMLVKLLGKSTVGIGYAICGAEFLLGPVVPSNTARGGGILAPITLSLANALDSHPGKNPERAGEYLVLVGAHANLIAAAMFLTGMAANPLVARAASDIFDIDFGWGTWALGAIVPGLIGLLLLPLFLNLIAKPTLKDTLPAQEKARKELELMGNWKPGEKMMGIVFIVLIVLWSTKPFHGMGTTLVAWIGVCLLILTRTLKWGDIIEISKAWDTLIWLGGLLTMANSLKNYGLIDWFSSYMQDLVGNFNGITVILILALIYFYSMYGFSMLTAHISALVAAFFGVALGVGAPVMLSIAILAYFSNLCACTTNYSTGPVIIYFGLGYVPAHTWFSKGFLVSLFHLVIWLGPGMIWWKMLGWW